MWSRHCFVRNVGFQANTLRKIMLTKHRQVANSLNFRYEDKGDPFVRFIAYGLMLAWFGDGNKPGEKYLFSCPLTHEDVRTLRIQFLDIIEEIVKGNRHISEVSHSLGNSKFYWTFDYKPDVVAISLDCEELESACLWLEYEHIPEDAISLLERIRKQTNLE